jgi:hypothetical protein
MSFPETPVVRSIEQEGVPSEALPFDALWALVERLDPEGAHQLIQAFPELALGEPMGHAESYPLHKASAVAARGLRQAIAWSSTFLDALHRRLRWSKVLFLAGQLLTFIGGAAFLTSLARAHEPLRLTLGVLTLSGSLVGLVAHWLSRTFTDAPVHKLLGDLAADRGLAQEVLRTLAVLRPEEDGQELDEARAGALARAVRQAEGIARRIRELHEREHGPVQPARRRRSQTPPSSKRGNA